MARIYQFPDLPEKEYLKIEDVIERRINDYNHCPELAGIIMATVKETLKEFVAPRTQLSLTLNGGCSPENAEIINEFIKEINKDGEGKFSKMLTEIIRLKIEMCEHMYFYELEKKKPIFHLQSSSSDTEISTPL